MINLETAIPEWRQRMLAAGIQNPVPLEELESHLRDESEQQVKAGLSEAAAFKTAVESVGGAQKVRAEFAKVDAAGMSREEKAMGVMLLTFAILMPVFMARTVWVKRADMTTGQLLSNLTALATFAGLIWAGRLGYRLFPVIRAKRTRDLFGGVAAGTMVLWWMVFLRVIVPRLEFPMMQFLATFMWAFFTPAGVLMGLILGMDTAARKQAARLSTTDGQG
jgi:hypothetical protein